MACWHKYPPAPWAVAMAVATALGGVSSSASLAETKVKVEVSKPDFNSSDGKASVGVEHTKGNHSASAKATTESHGGSTSQGGVVTYEYRFGK